MPIDITLESPISLIQATAHVPRRRRGRKAAASTLHRWATRGLREIHLETIQVGGTKCTSVAALQRFFDALSGLTDKPRALLANSDRAQRAERELDCRWGNTD